MAAHRKAWNDLLPHVRDVKPLYTFRDARVGVDLTEWFQSSFKHYREKSRAIGRRKTTYVPEELFEMTLRRHDRLVKHNMQPIYVFEGARVPTKLPPRTMIQNQLSKLDQLYQSIPRTGKLLNYPQLKEFALGLRLVEPIDPKLSIVVAQFMKDQGLPVLGAPYEATWQLLELQQSGQIDYIFSSNIDLAFMGATDMLTHTRFRIRLQDTCPLSRRNDILNYSDSPWEFHNCPDKLIEMKHLYGSNYCRRLNKYFPAEEVLQRLWPGYCEQGDEYLKQRGATDQYLKLFHCANNLWRHAPVLRQQENGDIHLVPLRDLPDDGSTWEERLGFDPVASLGVLPSEYNDASQIHSDTNFTTPSVFPWSQEVTPVEKAEWHYTDNEPTDGLRDTSWPSRDKVVPRQSTQSRPSKKEATAVW